MDFSGRVAIVTGAAQGIGQGIAVELAQAGASLCIADLDRAQAEEVARKIRETGRQAIAVGLDVADSNSVRNCVRDTVSELARVDILVNNAGIFQSRLGLDVQDDDFNRCLDVNLTGIWRMASAVVPHFRAQNSGKIVNIASVGGRVGMEIAPAYCASKAGVINLTQSLAGALANYNINVNAVCPGSIPTAMLDEIKTMMAESKLQADHDRTPQRLCSPLTPEDIGRAVVFLASNWARNITGQALNVDCGYLMN